MSDYAFFLQLDVGGYLGAVWGGFGAALTKKPPMMAITVNPWAKILALIKYWECFPRPCRKHHRPQPNAAVVISAPGKRRESKGVNFILQGLINCYWLTNGDKGVFLDFADQFVASSLGKGVFPQRVLPKPNPLQLRPKLVVNILPSHSSYNFQNTAQNFNSSYYSCSLNLTKISSRQIIFLTLKEPASWTFYNFQCRPKPIFPDTIKMSRTLIRLQKVSSRKSQSVVDFRTFTFSLSCVLIFLHAKKALMRMR